MANIIVGVDGSEASRRALAWALEEAKLREAHVVAVHAWTYPIVPPTIGGPVPYVPGIDFADEAKNLLDREIKEVSGGLDDVAIEPRVVRGHAVSALLGASDGADMLVIGSRGLGGFGGLLLGSVGHQCAQHARCPVVIVPHER